MLDLHKAEANSVVIYVHTPRFDGLGVCTFYATNTTTRRIKRLFYFGSMSNVGVKPK